MALSKRLFSIFSMVEKGSIAADIGCDHGLLSIALVQEKICSHVYACDLRKGPLSRAQDAIFAAGLQDQITTILCDGMDGIGKDVTTVIIAGMGFDTMRSILEKHLDTLSNYQRIILQCNKNVDELRRWISSKQYTILCEDIVEEDHYYEILAIHCQQGRTLSEDEILFGTNQNHPLFVPYWQHRLDKINKILVQMPSSQPEYATFVALQNTIQQKLKSRL